MRLKAPAIAAFLILVMGGAGCIAPQAGNAKDGPSGSLQGTLRTYDDPTATVDIDSVKGGFRGQVLNTRGAPLAKSHVTLTKTPLFMTTGNDGRFQFLELEPRTYRVRVDPLDPKSYHSFEGNIEVVAGKIGYVDIVLEAKVDEGSIHHSHDRWENKTEIELVKGSFSIPPEGPLCFFDLSATAAGQGAGAEAQMPEPLGQPMLGYATGCGIITFYPEGEKIVPPGTKELKVTIDWSKRDYVKTVTFKFMTPNITGFAGAGSRVISFTPGQTSTIFVDKPGKVMNISDHGHQKFSMWGFRIEVVPAVEVPTADGKSQSRALPKMGYVFNDQYIGAFNVRIVAIKGDSIPFEKPHARFWDQGNSIKLLSGVSQTLSRSGSVERKVKAADCWPMEMCFVIPEDKVKTKLVAPGTTRMKIKLETAFGSPDTLDRYQEKGLAIRTAGQSYHTTTLAQMKVFEPKTRSLSEVTWEIPIDEKDTDPYYAGRSTWAFLVGNLGDERNPEYMPDCLSLGCNGETYKLTVEIFNDNWTPEYKT